MIQSFENEFMWGSGKYPATLNAAYGYLVNYRKDQATQKTTSDGLGVAFYNKHNKDKDEKQQASAGQGGGNSIQFGNKGQRLILKTASSNGKTGNPPPKSDKPDTSKKHTSLCMAKEDCHTILDGSSSLQDILLLDSCSSVNLVSNANMLHDIHQDGGQIVVKCNAGKHVLDTKARLGDFAGIIWHDPAGSVNLLSLDSVKEQYNVVYDSANGNSFIANNQQGLVYEFKSLPNGLYGNTKPNKWVFISTVNEISQKYSKKSVNKARKQGGYKASQCSHPWHN